MSKSFSIGRLVISIGLAKSGLWGKGEDTYLLHIGTFSRDNHTALKIIILPLSLMVGWA